jgi:hypothetical protein
VEDQRAEEASKGQERIVFVSCRSHLPCERLSNSVRAMQGVGCSFRRTGVESVAPITRVKFSMPTKNSPRNGAKQ